ncbi:MAG: response regulator transcription factor [Clostridia bacterium]|nr:response regulator transcription factor [Clostridia bacterium]MBQ4365798.1 response regulator transcription factor [Clostridia bacterium]MBR3094205.1 response regulator transcription factor [Clostridia bacterium]
MKILIVDDEKEIAELVAVYLKNEGFETELCHNGADALKAVRERPFDLAVLDVMLPDTDGFALCRAIREQYHYPVVMLTARTGDSDKISGLAFGADDYVTKPFSPPELVARIKAQLRRYTQYNDGPPQNVFEHAGLKVDSDTHKCFLFDEEIALTPIEFGILSLLCRRAGKVVSTEEIFETVWGEEYLDSNNTVMVHIRRIREKLHEPSRNPRFVKTVWGVGYKIETK